MHTWSFSLTRTTLVYRIHLYIPQYVYTAAIQSQLWRLYNSGHPHSIPIRHRHRRQSLGFGHEYIVTCVGNIRDACETSTKSGESLRQSRAAAHVAATVAAERRSVDRSVGRPHEEFSFHTWRLLTVKSAATAAATAAAASRDHVCVNCYKAYIYIIIIILLL